MLHRCQKCGAFLGDDHAEWCMYNTSKKEMKMTREQAINKLKMLKYNPLNYEENQLKILEALGLLKFEEPETKTKPTVESIIINRNLSALMASSIIDDLSKHGYKIIDIELYEIVDRRQDRC